ncbi:MAG: hypothetical protein GX811_03820, partial [Lentisphaerae bacterium]|nr:hypothetical protein [Lentisphaerota bacterium]
VYEGNTLVGISTVVEGLGLADSTDISDQVPLQYRPEAYTVKVFTWEQGEVAVPVSEAMSTG